MFFFFSFISDRRYIAGILPIYRQRQNNKSINFFHDVNVKKALGRKNNDKGHLIHKGFSINFIKDIGQWWRY